MNHVLSYCRIYTDISFGFQYTCYHWGSNAYLAVFSFPVPMLGGILQQPVLYEEILVEDL